MASNCLFVRVPGTPFRFDDFQPDTELLRLACEALGEYDRVGVEDLGRLETFERFYPPESVPEALRWATGLSGEETLAYAHGDGTPIEKRMPASIRRRHLRIYDELGERLIAPHRPETIVFKIDHLKDLRPTLRMAQRIRALRPTVRLLGFGGGLENTEGVALEALKSLDCISPSADGRNLLSLQKRTLKRTWHEVGGLAYHDGVRLVCTPRTPEGWGGSWDWDLQGMEKILYNTGEAYSILRVLSLNAVHSTMGSSSMRPLQNARRGAASDVVNAMRKFASAFGTAAFSIRTDSGLPALAQAILNSRLHIAYSAVIDPATAQKDRLGILAASGCAAADVWIRSGSRRLLDTYHHHTFSLIDTETMLRSARHSGIFTSGQFVFPCAEDDHHTADETLRFVKRSRAASACLHLEGDPGSALKRGWFRTGPRDIKREETDRRRFGAAIRRLGVSTGVTGAQALLARLAGFAEREEEFCRLTALQLLTGDVTGVAETFERINDHARRRPAHARIKPFTIDAGIAAN